MSKRMLIIGRWCPFHNGHKYLVDSHLNGGTPVCIAIRDTDEKYTAEQRKQMIEAVYPDKKKVKVVIIPDIMGVAVGRGVGYFIAKVPEEVQECTGGGIGERGRRSKRIGARGFETGCWRSWNDALRSGAKKADVVYMPAIIRDEIIRSETEADLDISLIVEGR